MKAARSKTIVLMGTLDTKGLEVGFVRDWLERRGHRTIVVDAGVLGKPQIKADIQREKVARAGGKSLKELIEDAQKGSDRVSIIQVMVKGAAEIVKQLYSQGKLDGIFSLGGSMGAAIGANAMKALPVGVPKLMLSTHLYSQAVGEADITVMQSPTDIMGLNPITNRTLAYAAGAISGMVEVQPLEKKTKPLIGITAMGVTTPGAMMLQSLLQARGYDTVVFHVNSEVMDKLVAEGVIDGILDYTPCELIRIFITSETPERVARLEIAGRRGIPQVIVPGGLDMIVLRVARDELPERYKNRKIYMHGPFVTAVRTTREELVRLAEVISDKANRATGPMAMVIPLKGFSEIDKEGKAFYEPETNTAFVSELTKRLKKTIVVKEVEYHINDKQFAEEVVRIYDQISKGGR